MVATGDLESLTAVLDMIRTGAAGTRPELARLSGLGRDVVGQRVAQLMAVALVQEGPPGPSTGGRSARRLRLAAETGFVLVAELGATSIGVALADLSGRLTGEREEPADVSLGPEKVLARVDELFSEVLREVGSVSIWGVGIGLPGPVEFRTGLPVAPPIMPGWDGFDVRGYFAERYNAPVWVDNDVNVMALGELHGGVARDEKDLVYVKIGSGIGAGLVSEGRLHRGAQGCAGDIGHIAATDDPSVVCRCGKVGCLEALAGGAALGRDGTAAGREGRSKLLAEALESKGGALEASDVVAAARRGDAVSHEILARSATLVGEALARIVNFFNPSLVLIGGGVAEAGDTYLAVVRQVVFSRSLPLATRNLRILRSPLSDHSGLVGAALMVVQQLMTRRVLAEWVHHGTPAGRPELAELG